jgi:muramidase (phage lysozyme)
MSPNLSAFLRVIREGETSQDDIAYRTIVGGGTFDSFADHPRQLVYLPSLGLSSTAAGAYQFLSRTWDGVAKKLGLPDFSPESQDRAAVELIRGRGALQDVEEGRFEAALAKCNKEWASLPGSPYGQHTISLARCKDVYETYGGTYGVQERQGETSPEEVKEVRMSNTVFIGAAIEALSAAIPALNKIFKGSDTAERNQKAAEVVVKVAKDAIGARNEQELINELQSSPESVKTVSKAIEDQWFQIIEAGGGGIKGASERAVAMAESNQPMYKNPAFIVTLLLMPLVYVVVGAVLWKENIPQDLLVMTVTAVISGVLSGIMGFWLGTSFGSSKKTDILARK